MSSHNNKLYFLFVFILFSANIWGMKKDRHIKNLWIEKSDKKKLQDKEKNYVQDPLLISIEKEDYSLLKDYLEKGDIPDIGYPGYIEEIVCKKDWSNIVEVWDKKGYKSPYLLATATLFASDKLFMKILEKREENFKNTFHYIAGDILLWDNSQENFVKRIKTLQQYGISIDSTNEKGKTPLSIACKNCKLLVVISYLLAGADINTVKDSQLIDGSMSAQVARNWRINKDWKKVISLLDEGGTLFQLVADIIRVEKNIK